MFFILKKKYGFLAILSPIKVFKWRKNELKPYIIGLNINQYIICIFFGIC